MENPILSVHTSDPAVRFFSISTMKKMKQVLMLLSFCALFVCQSGCVSFIEPKLTRKAEQGDKVAQNDLGSVYLSCNNPRKAAEWFRKAAEQGYVMGQYNLGLMYRLGRGVPQNYAEAMKWFRMAAEQGDPVAQNDIGHLYSNGYGVPQDYAEALKWYHQAAEQGNAMAQFNIGLMHRFGQGVPKNDVEAARWYRMAAAQGFADAIKNLNFIDKFEATLVLANQGDPSAQNDIGYMYENGDGVTQNHGEAMKWYFSAAFRGNVYAQYNVARMYRDGYGVIKDEIESLAWYYVALHNPERGKIANIDNIIAGFERRVGVYGRQSAQQRAGELSNSFQIVEKPPPANPEK